MFFNFSETWAIYRVSYLWYTLTGALVTMSIGLFVSIISSEKVDKLDPMLVAPFIRKYLKNNNSIELHQVQVCWVIFNLYIRVRLFLLFTKFIDVTWKYLTCMEMYTKNLFHMGKSGVKWAYIYITYKPPFLKGLISPHSSL